MSRIVHFILIVYGRRTMSTSAMIAEIRILLSAVLIFHSFGQDFKKRYEFEDVVGGAGSARSPWRSAASGVSSLHMFKGDQIELTLCTDVSTSLRIDGLIYSNDGESDMIDVSVRWHSSDPALYDTVLTEGNSGGWGMYWDVYKSSGPIGIDHLLLTRVSNTTIVFTVNVADCYGSEFDAIDVTLSADVANETLWCDAKLIYAANPTHCAVKIDNPELLLATPFIEKTTAATPTTTTEATRTTTAEATPVKTTPTTTAEATPTTTPETSVATNEATTATPNSVQQKSFESDCIDESNVNIRLNPSVLKNATFIAREQTAVRHSEKTTSNKAGRACNTNIWQIGLTDNRNDELGPGVQTPSITYVVDNVSNVRTFPGTISQGQPGKIDVKYHIPRKFNVHRGKLEFTLGLNNVNKDKTIGVQYLKRAKINSSDINYQTFSPSNKVNEWNIPAKAVSPSLENVLTLHFDRLGAGSVDVDYLKLSYNPRKWGRQHVTLNTDRTWTIRALKYKENANKKNKEIEIPKGMHVYVDGQRIDGEIEKVVCMHKPHFRILAISESGEIYLNHVTRTFKRQDRKSMRDDDEDQLKEVSGFTIGSADNDIETVTFNTSKDEIKIKFANNKFVTFSVHYSALETKLIVTDTNIVGEPVTFFSTHIADSLAGVNDVIVNGLARKHVMDPSVGQLTGKSFKFVKTNADHTFDVSDEIEVVFT